MQDTTARIALIWGRKPRRSASAEELVHRVQAGGGNALLLEPGRTAAIRLNTDFGTRYSPDRLSAVPDTTAKLEALRAGVAQDLDLFARNPRRLLDLYFAFVTARIEAEKDSLEKALAWSHGLFRAEDYSFSALAPLPNACAVTVAGDGPAGSVHTSDFAFWTGSRLLAVTVRGAAAGTASPERPGESPIVRLDIPAAALSAADCPFADASMPAEVRSFWQGEAVPSSPFRPQGLEQGITPG